MANENYRDLKEENKNRDNYDNDLKGMTEEQFNILLAWRAGCIANGRTSYIPSRYRNQRDLDRE